MSNLSSVSVLVFSPYIMALKLVWLFLENGV